MAWYPCIQMRVAAAALAWLLLFSSGPVGVRATVFNLVNKCPYMIWPGVLSGKGPSLVGTDGGFALPPGQSREVSAPLGWSGRFWGRTGCTFDSSGNGPCATGDCGNVLKCQQAGGTPPVSLAEFTLQADKDYYDVSLVDGYNVPVNIVPNGGAGDQCKVVGCFNDDLRNKCPPELRVSGGNGQVTGCKSACLALGSAEYCCTGDHGTPQTCPPTNYSQVFKSACPNAYSYAYDDPSSLFSCTQSPNYDIIFCPSAQ